MHSKMEQRNITDRIIRWPVRLYGVVYAFQIKRLRATDVDAEAVGILPFSMCACVCLCVLVLQIEEDIESDAHCQI